MLLSPKRAERCGCMMAGLLQDLSPGSPAGVWVWPAPAANAGREATTDATGKAQDGGL
jgi:hypothetical protein